MLPVFDWCIVIKPIKCVFPVAPEWWWDVADSQCEVYCSRPGSFSQSEQLSLHQGWHTWWYAHTDAHTEWLGYASNTSCCLSLISFLLQIISSARLYSCLSLLLSPLLLYVSLHHCRDCVCFLPLNFRTFKTEYYHPFLCISIVPCSL